MGRKGVSITFYESEEEDMPKLKEVEEKYNMPITPLSMSDVETFEKTVKDALKWVVCSIPVDPLRINGSIFKIIHLLHVTPYWKNCSRTLSRM